MNEYLTSNEYVAFPFRDDAPGIARVGVSPNYVTPLLPSDFFLDLVMTYYGGEQLYLKNVNESGGSYEIRLGTETEVLATGLITPSPAREVVAFQNVPEGITVRAVTGGGLSDYLAGLTGGLDFGTSLPLTEAAMDAKPSKLLTLGHDAFSHEGVIELLEGHNVSMAYEESTSELTISVIPGDGQGRYDPCADPAPIDYVASINGKRTDDVGKFLLGSDGGVWRVISTPGGAQLVNDAQPCCTCDDYRKMSAFHNVTFERLRELRNELWATIALYNLHVTYFNDEVVPYLNGVLIYGSGRSGHKENHNSSYVTVTIAIHNVLGPRQLQIDHILATEAELVDSWVTVGDVTTVAVMTEHLLVLEKNQVAVYTFVLKGAVPPMTTNVAWVEDEGPRSVIKVTEW